MGSAQACGMSLSGKACAALIALILVAAVAAAFNRNAFWADEFSIWGDTVLKSPAKVRPNNEVGRRYAEAGRYDAALAWLRKAVSINPYEAPPHSNLGSVYYKTGLLDDAEREYRLAILYGPPYEDLHRNLGLVYMKKGLTARAMREFARAVELMPGHRDFTDTVKLIYNNEAFSYTDASEFQRALILHRLAASLDPGYANAHYGMALAYEGLGEDEKSAAHWREYLRLAPPESGQWRDEATAHLERLTGGAER